MIISATTYTSLSFHHRPPHRHRHLRHNHHRNNHRHFTLVAAATTDKPVIIIGAGLSGLAAATKLHKSNIPFLLLEASDGVGGRVRTDHHNGYILDRGFQIFITAYPEARELLDYSSLNLRKFYSGARVYFDGGFHDVADPIRHFRDSIGSLTNPIGTFFDKLLVGLARIRVLTKSDDVIMTSDEVTVIELLHNLGFSDKMIDRFFRPFFGGIFLDTELETTSRLFDFIFKCLALGDNTLPEKGIGEIPNQLASKLPPESIRLNSRVISIKTGSSNTENIVRLSNGEEFKTENGLILAVEEPEIAQILSKNTKITYKTTPQKPPRSAVNIYFSTKKNSLPSSDPIIYLNGSSKGIVNVMYFVTNVAESYAPVDKALVSVSLVGLYDDVSDEELVGRVVDELSGWFSGSTVRSWEYMRMYRIRFGQPNQSPPTDPRKDPRLGSGVYLCGDYLTSATFHGALVSGRKAVEALLQDLRVNYPV